MDGTEAIQLLGSQAIRSRGGLPRDSIDQGVGYARATNRPVSYSCCRPDVLLLMSQNPFNIKTVRPNDIVKGLGSCNRIAKRAACHCEAAIVWSLVRRYTAVRFVASQLLSSEAHVDQSSSARWLDNLPCLPTKAGRKSAVACTVLKTELSRAKRGRVPHWTYGYSLAGLLTLRNREKYTRFSESP